jgi:hypothetical protein
MYWQGGPLPTPQVAAHFSKFRQFVDRFRQFSVEIRRKIGKEQSDEFRRLTGEGG